MNNLPIISVIIPTFNRKDLLRDTLDSILGQTYKNIEVIIVSDCSTDGTAQLFKNLKDSRIKYYELPKNKKYPSIVRNIGAQYAIGDFIAFCDDDDIWVPNKLATQIEEFYKNEKLQLVATNGRFFPGYKINIFQNKRDFEISYGEMLKVNYVITSSVLMRAKIFKELGGFDENPILHIGEDYDLWLRIIKDNYRSLLFMAEPLVYYRIGNVKIMNSYQDVESYYQRQLYIYKKHMPESNSYIKELNRRSLQSETVVLKRQLMSKISLQLYSKQCSIFEIITNNKLGVKDKFVIFSKFVGKLVNQL